MPRTNSIQVGVSPQEPYGRPEENSSTCTSGDLQDIINLLSNSRNDLQQEVRELHTELQLKEELILRFQHEYVKLQELISHMNEEKGNLDQSRNLHPETPATTLSQPETSRITHDDLTPFRRYHNTHRLLEFCGNTRKVLWNRMQPRQMKTGNGLLLGQCPAPLLKFFFDQQPFYTSKISRRKVVRDGLETHVSIQWYIYNEKMPDLGGRWSSKYYKRGSEMYHSYYTRIAFGVNTEDNRVYVNYTQVTTLLWNNSSFLVPG